MPTLIVATLMAFAAVGILCYEAGADAGKRAQFDRASAEALALVAETTALAPGWVEGWPESRTWDDSGSRERHPSR